MLYDKLSAMKEDESEKAATGGGGGALFGLSLPQAPSLPSISGGEAAASMRKFAQSASGALGKFATKPGDAAAPGRAAAEASTASPHQLGERAEG